MTSDNCPASSASIAQMPYEQFQKVIAECALTFRASAKRNVLLLHHNDTDGLSSGAILSKALERMRLHVRRYCLEKPYPQVIDRLLNDEFIASDTVVVLADFGSGMLPSIAAINRERFPIYILDHHAPNAAPDRCITLINPRACGVDGDQDCSASALCALFAQELGEFNDDLWVLGALGALGDGMVSSTGELSGINAHCASAAISSGVLSFDGHYYFLPEGRAPLEAKLFKSYIDALGGIGYYRGGSDVALKGLLEGFDERYVFSAQKFLSEYTSALSSLSAAQIERKGNLQWFQLGPMFTGMGVKTVGLACEALIAQGVSAPDCYLLGVQMLNPEVPGMGAVLPPQFKISMRVPHTLQAEVIAGRSPDLVRVMRRAGETVGAFVDALHKYAGAVTVPVGAKDEFIAAVQHEVSGR